MVGSEWKIWRCVSPVLIYLFVSMMVQVVFSVVITMNEFYNLGGEGLMNYFSTYNFSGSVEKVVTENGLLIQFVTSVITIIIGARMMKKDEDMLGKLPISEHIKKINLGRWYYIAGLGALASMGLSKVVTILPIDNIWGSYQRVEEEFASNPMVFQVLTLVVAGPVIEEIVFRGLVYKRIKGYTSDMTAVYASSIGFGLFHFNLVQGIYAFALGILLCFVYEKYKTIVAPVIFHMTANLLALLMMHSSSSVAINNNIFLKILFMIIEVSALVLLLWKMNTFDEMGRKSGKEKK